MLALTGCVSATAPRGIYFVMVDRFENGDRSNDAQIDEHDPQAFHGGDLQGVINRLDWIKSLGFDTVWLSPIFSMRTDKWHGYGAFHGYWTWDLSRLEPRFGTEATLQTLREALSKRGMKLLLDLVLNHVGPEAPLITTHPDWFHRRGGVTDWNDPTQLVMNDVHGLPDLDTEKPEVRKFLFDATKKWKADGFRLDAVKHVPLEFWKALSKDQGGGILLGELLDGSPDTLSKTWNEGGFTNLFDFPLAFGIADVFCRGAPPARLAAILTNDRRYPDANALVTLVDNHDLPRILSVCGGDLEKTKHALTFLFSMRGIPSIAWGTEVGSDGAKEPDNRKSMRFEPHPLREHIAALMARRRGALNDGATVITEVTDTRLVLSRISRDETIDVIVENGTTRVEAAPTRAVPKAQNVRVTFTGNGSIVGSGPEFGDWDRAKAVPLPHTVDLPLGGVFEFKRLLDGEWEAGGNRVLFVTPTTTQVSL